MRGAGLSFSASADLARNYPRPPVKAAFLPLLLKTRDRERAELYRDYVSNAFFAPTSMPGSARAAAVSELIEAFRFGSKVPFA